MAYNDEQNEYPLPAGDSKNPSSANFCLDTLELKLTKSF